MRLRRPSPLLGFVLSAFVWMVALTGLWTQASPWTSYPVGVLSKWALEKAAPMWVRSVDIRPGQMLVESPIAVPVPSAGGRLGEVSVEADPGRYAYGLPIFLALLLAARGPRRLGLALGGYALLLPLQAFSATMYVLMQLMGATGMSAHRLLVEHWQMEALVYGYQVGALVVPTLAPIMVWLWLDRRFFADTVVRGWQGAAPLAPRGAEIAAQDTVAAPVPEPAPIAPPAPPRGRPRVPGGGEISSSASAGLPPRA